MDGEGAQLAGLTISANYRIACPGDPVGWFATQCAFDRCATIAFRTEAKRRIGKDRRVAVALTPSDWLAALVATGVRCVTLCCTRQDGAEQDTIRDRLTAGLAGGGSLCLMISEAADGGAICWTPGWRAAYPQAEDGRIWAVECLAVPCAPVSTGPSVELATTRLADSLSAIQTFASQHHFETITAIFASAQALLVGDPDPHADPRFVPRPPGPADILSAPARQLRFAAQRAWTFDNLSLWRDQDFSQDTWRDYARLSERPYNDVTAAITAAVNASIPKL